MPEFIFVKYWRRRTVLVGGQRRGMTNTSIPVAAGRNAVRLSPPDNYRPSRRIPDVQGTTARFPMELEFKHEDQV